MFTYYIYGLCDPDYGEFMYIGQTCDVNTRLQNHLSESRSERLKDHPKNIWLRELVSQNKLPEVYIIEETTKEMIFAREKYWIKMFAKAGYPLTNLEVSKHRY